MCKLQFSIFRRKDVISGKSMKHGFKSKNIKSKICIIVIDVKETFRRLEITNTIRNFRFFGKTDLGLLQNP